MSVSCPALLISAPASNHGKTTVTAALARWHTQQGRRVRVFKAGPDFLDPMILAQACAQPVYHLDLWLAGVAACRALVAEAAQQADLILIEGVMGLFDGDPSSADLAQALAVPVLAVIDARGAAQTVGALAYGLAHYRSGLPFYGMLANSVASARHAEMIAQGMPPGLRYCGGLPRTAEVALPARHLGLVAAAEIGDLEARLAAGAAALGQTSLATLPPPVLFEQLPTSASAFLPLQGLRIGIARDAAFCFIYPANLDLLRALGAELVFFSPLTDRSLPALDSIYLPGGYPELHMQALQDNLPLRAALHAHHAHGKPIYAECGGMLYLLQTLTDQHGQCAQMLGLLPGTARMQPRLQGLGYQSLRLPSGVLRAHTFHHSLVSSDLVPVTHGERLHNTSAGEPVFQVASLTASYLHCYFPSCPAAAAALFLPTLSSGRL